MADKPSDRVPDAIKNHKPKHTYEMNGLGGSRLRKANAEKQLHQDVKDNSGKIAAHRAKIKNNLTVKGTDVVKGSKGLLSKEFKNNEDDRSR